MSRKARRATYQIVAREDRKHRLPEEEIDEFYSRGEAGEMLREYQDVLRTRSLFIRRQIRTLDEVQEQERQEAIEEYGP